MMSIINNWIAEQKTPLSFCAFKYYPHICSAKTVMDCYPYRGLRLMLTKYDGLFLCPYINHFTDVSKMIHTKLAAAFPITLLLSGGNL